MEFTNFIDFASKVGIWCACFLILAVYTLKHYEKLVKETKEDSKQREDQLRKENDDREIRYINTINNLTNKVYNQINVIDEKVDKIQEKIDRMEE